MDYTLPDLTFTPGDQGLTTVDLTGLQTPDISSGTSTFYGIGPTNVTGAPQYPSDPTADNPGNQMAPASSATTSLFGPSTLNSWVNDIGALVGAGTQLYAAANQYSRVPVNVPGASGSAYVNSTTGLPAGSNALAQSMRGIGGVPAPLLLGGLALLILALRK